MGIVCFDDSSVGVIRAAALLLLCAVVLSGCSSRGSAPVYNRTAQDHSVSSTPHKRPRPPAYSRTYYLVQPGDTLYSIAWRQSLSYRDLASWNGVRPPGYRIFPGQRLRLKAPERSRSGSAPRSSKPVTVATPKTAPKPSIKPAAKPPAYSRPPVAAVNKPAVPKSSSKRLKLAWNWPTKGRVVQTFSAGDDTRKGIWIQGQLGQKVNASESGKVVYAGNGLVGYGNLIIIKHDRSYLSAYGYNSKLLVKEGDEVRRGDVVAYMGTPNTGAQPVLHFEVRRQGRPINPLPLLPRKK